MQLREGSQCAEAMLCDSSYEILVKAKLEGE